MSCHVQVAGITQVLLHEKVGSRLFLADMYVRSACNRPGRNYLLRGAGKCWARALGLGLGQAGWLVLEGRGAR
jgi:hypothetical protein